MISLWKLLVLLCCVQRGEGRRLRSLLDQRGEMASSTTGSSAEDRRARLAGEEPDPPSRRGARTSQGVRSVPASWGGAFSSSAQKRSRRASPAATCSLRSILLRVRDLGLGYDSDETVLFRYCGGACERVRSNHDLALANLLSTGALPRPPPPGEPWLGTSCCRPTHHEDLAFLDNTHRWHKVEKLLAAGCSCVG